MHIILYFVNKLCFNEYHFHMTKTLFCRDFVRQNDEKAQYIVGYLESA